MNIKAISLLFVLVLLTTSCSFSAGEEGLKIDLDALNQRRPDEKTTRERMEEAKRRARSFSRY